jgi:hypothetical protein
MKLTATVLIAAAVVILAPHVHTGSLIRDLGLKALLLALYGAALLACRSITVRDLVQYWKKVEL